MKLFPDIKPKEASKKLEIEYTKSFCNSFYLIKNKPLNTTKTPKKTITLAKGKPSNVVNTDLIDDPNELLMSCAMRELNKSNPEVRWANILLQLLDKTKQLEAKSKSDVQSQLKQYSTSELIELRKKLIES